MEVLLLDDVAGLGKKNDLLVVKEGFALNCLLPHRQAIVATPTVRRRYAEQIRKRAEERVVEDEFKRSSAAQLSGKEIAFSKKVTKTGKLYAAITEKHIAEEAKKQLNIDVDEKTLNLGDQIKSTGEFEVSAAYGDHQQTFKVIVKAEK